jgi:hypothetical protein
VATHGVTAAEAMRTAGQMMKLHMQGKHDQRAHGKGGGLSAGVGGVDGAPPEGQRRGRGHTRKGMSPQEKEALLQLGVALGATAISFGPIIYGLSPRGSKAIGRGMGRIGRSAEQAMGRERSAKVRSNRPGDPSPKQAKGLLEQGLASANKKGDKWRVIVPPFKVPNGNIWHAAVRDDALGLSMPVFLRYDQARKAWAWEMGNYRQG